MIFHGQPAAARSQTNGIFMSHKLPLPPQPGKQADPTLSPTPLPISLNPAWPIPGKAQCLAWWDMYDMLDNVRAHSLQVARVAADITRLVCRSTEKTFGAQSQEQLLQTICAAALLHDLAKTYCIRHGGNHAQVGASWVVDLTKNPAIGQGVLHHVFWPGPADPSHFFLPLVIAYSDKRVRHDEIVSLDTRLDDLLVRYGRTQKHREMIRRSFDQVRDIETRLEQQTGVDLNAYSFDSRGLVQ